MERIFTAQTQPDDAYLYIGKVAQMTGASCKAIRHYESLEAVGAEAISPSVSFVRERSPSPHRSKTHLALE